MSLSITILPEFAASVGPYSMIAVEAAVVNGPTSDALWAEIHSAAESICTRMADVADINRYAPIAATRAAYKACGKDPNRYRPAQEQLYRRIKRGLGLYTVSTLVDIGNLLSLLTGCAVGVFDRDKIAGHAISLGVGHASEPYTGIGRGPINIEGMPVLRDADGAFGSMTSDHERTKIDAGTRRILITIHLFDTAITPASVIAAVERLLKEYAHASADDMNIRVIAKQ